MFELMVVPSDHNSYFSSISNYIDSDNLLSISLFVCQDTRKGKRGVASKSAFSKNPPRPGFPCGEFCQ